jgi:AraC-like DNA-binding protein
MIEFLKNQNNAHFKTDAETTAKLTELFDNAVQCNCNNDAFTDFRIVRLIGDFIVLISRFPSTGNYAPLPQSRISQILKYVHDNFSNNLTVSEICKKFDIGSTTLHNMFCTNLGMPPGEYILRRKLMHAESLLKEGKSVTEAANISGFNSYSHFIRIFKSRMGMPPHKYTNNT